MTKLNSVGVIGLGNVGGALLSVLAQHVPMIYGYDIKPEMREKAKSAVPKAVMCGSLAELADCTTTVFIVTPTPELPDGGFDRSIVESVISSLSRRWFTSNEQPTVICVSTLFPGDSAVLNTLFKSKVDGTFIYAPAFIKQGSVEADLTKTDFYLFGTDGGFIPDGLQELYDALANRVTPHIETAFINAEIAKLMLNVHLATRIALANMSVIFTELYGGDASMVNWIIGYDKRIGSSYLMPGSPFGGPCLPRDMRAVNKAISSAPDNDTLPAFSLAGDVHEFNEQYKFYISGKVRAIATQFGSPVGIYGFGYKSDTHVVDEGLGAFLVKQCLERGIPVRWFDDDALPGSYDGLGKYRVKTLADLFELPTLVWTYNKLPYQFNADLVPKLSEMTCLDVWGIFANHKEKFAHYSRLGVRYG